MGYYNENTDIYLGFLISQENLPDEKTCEELIGEHLLWTFSEKNIFGFKLGSIKPGTVIAIPDEYFLTNKELAIQETHIYNLALEKIPGGKTSKHWPKIYIANEEWL